MRHNATRCGKTTRRRRTEEWEAKRERKTYKLTYTLRTETTATTTRIVNSSSRQWQVLRLSYKICKQSSIVSFPVVLICAGNPSTHTHTHSHIQRRHPRAAPHPTGIIPSRNERQVQRAKPQCLAGASFTYTDAQAHAHAHVHTQSYALSTKTNIKINAKKRHVKNKSAREQTAHIKKRRVSAKGGVAQAINSKLEIEQERFSDFDNK